MKNESDNQDVVSPELLEAWRDQRAPATLAARLDAALDADTQASSASWWRPALTGAMALVLLLVVVSRISTESEDTPAMAVDDPMPQSMPEDAIAISLAGPPLSIPSLSKLKPMPTAAEQPPVRAGKLPSLLDIPHIGSFRQAATAEEKT